ncbi:MAG: response regulator transcription factor [Bacteroidales bacterium]|jgi:DNA-binding NarL/FixJ family response regulator|nr:response regulator transcription factor [Bacteroidales bacterium]
MRTYILADNQDITCEGLVSLILKEAPGTLIVHSPTIKRLLDSLRQYPDSVVVLDYTLFDFDSEQQMLNVIAGASNSSWLLFSDELSEQFLRYVLLSSPAISIVTKNDSLEVISEALLCVNRRERYICDWAEEILKRGVPKAKVPELLTVSEKSVLHEIALGKTTKEIAWEKHLSFHTVNTHRRNIFRKLGVNSVHEVVRYALKSGIINLTEYYI